MEKVELKERGRHMRRMSVFEVILRTLFVCFVHVILVGWIAAAFRCLIPGPARRLYPLAMGPPSIQTSRVRSWLVAGPEVGLSPTRIKKTSTVLLLRGIEEKRKKKRKKATVV